MWLFVNNHSCFGYIQITTLNNKNTFGTRYVFDSWFDIQSGHIYFQGQYFLYFSPFVCSIFLAIFIALVVLVFNYFLFIIFLQPLPGFQSYKGV